jgi:Uma2 family endonuclease
MSTVATQRLTADEFWELANRSENRGKWLELVRGEVVEMPPAGERHGYLCSWIGHLLWAYVLKRGSGGVAGNDTGFLVETGPDTVRGPDVMLFAETLPFGELSLKYSGRVPQLIVEVLSPSDEPNKVARRVEQYLRKGVPLVWVVSPAETTVAVYRPNEIQKVLDESEELTGEGVLADFHLPVATLFTMPGQ